MDRSQKPSFFREIRTFAIFFVAVFVLLLVFTNFQLFAYSFLSLFEPGIIPSAPITSSLISEDNGISTIVDTAQKNDAEIQ
ncbi:MAG: hypothetical protein WCJ45_08695 [bacterium]